MSTDERVNFPRLESSLYPWLLLIQLVTIVYLNYCWIANSEFMLRHDSLMHAQIVANYETSYDIGCPQPRLLHSILSLLMPPETFSRWPLFISEAIFLSIWVWGTYFLGKEMFSKAVGYLGATLLLSSAQTTVALRTFLLDYPYASLFIWQLWAYYRSQKFALWIPTLLFMVLIPIISGLRYHYAIYAAPLLLFCGLEQLWISRAFWYSHRKIFFKSAILTGLFSAIAMIFIANYRNVTFIDKLSLGLATTLPLSIFLYYISYKSNDIVAKNSMRYAILATTMSIMTEVIHTRIFVHAVFEAYASCNIAIPSHQIKDWISALFQTPQWFLGHLVELKWKNLQPLIFWMYLFGLAMLISSNKSRSRHMVCLSALIVTSLFMSLATYNPPRFQAPLLALRCIVASSWIYALAHIKNYRTTICHIIAGISFLNGLIFNGAWMVSKNWPSAKVAILQNDLIFDNACGGDFYEFTSTFIPEKRWNYTLSQGKLSKLLSWNSVWGNHPATTIFPYRFPWADGARYLLNTLPDNKQIIYVDMYPPELRTDEITCPSELAWLLDLSMRERNSSPIPYFLPLEQISSDNIPTYISIVHKPNYKQKLPKMPIQPLQYWKSDDVAISMFKYLR